MGQNPEHYAYGNQAKRNSYWEYLLFIGLFQLPGYFIAALCYVRAGADTGFPAIDIECPILWPVADDPVHRSYGIAE